MPARVVCGLLMAMAFIVGGWAVLAGGGEVAMGRNIMLAVVIFVVAVIVAIMGLLAGEIIEAKKDRTYRYTRDLIQELKKKGYYLLAISHSPKFIVDGFAYEMGFDKSYGTWYDTGASNRFTGEIVDEHIIMNKASVFTRALEKEKLQLAGSIAVGDTESDISMLTMVETPIAFNPNRLLYRHAKKHDWKIVVERKDVIYEI
jgi:HAD superfamily phosphoserine phosphatase-like hydrolase